MRKALHSPTVSPETLGNRPVVPGEKLHQAKKMGKRIARRTKDQRAQNQFDAGLRGEARAYKQIGLVLAEALKGTARKSKSGDPKQKQNAAGNAEGKQGMLGKGLTTKDGKLDAESVQHNMKANMNSQNAKGSGNKARRRLAALQNSSRAYKQIGLVLAEAMGHRVDEIAPLGCFREREPEWLLVLLLEVRLLLQG